MKKTINTIDILSCSSKATCSTQDETEKTLFELSRAFKKVVRTKSTIIKKTVKAMICNEMIHINDKSERIIHGKA